MAAVVADVEKERKERSKMGKRMSFSDPVKLTIIYGSSIVNMIAERQSYLEFCELATKVPCDEWITVCGMLNDFDANRNEICIRVETIDSIECTDVNS